MKTIKLFEGIKVTTDEEVKKYPDMTAFDECIKCTTEQRSEIIRTLIINGGTLDLTKLTEGKTRCILDLY